MTKIDIEVDTDSDRFKREVARNGNPLSQIALVYEDDAFPSRDWLDFPVVVLAWWLKDYFKLIRSHKTVVSTFMNGPFEFEIIPRGDQAGIVFRRRTTDGFREEGRTETALSQYGEALLRAARKLVQAIDGLGASGNDIDYLKSLLARDRVKRA